MLKKKNISVLWLLVFLCAGCFRAYSFDKGDFQVWNTNVEEKKIDDKTKISMEEEFRYGNNASELFYQHYDIGFNYEISKSLSLKLSYRYILNEKNNKFQVENQPNVNLTYKWDFLGCNMSNRSRLEYRIFDYQTDSWRYRDKITAKLPWKLTRYDIQPYLADEIFVSSIGASINNNRFYSGLTFKATKNFSGDMYYMRQNTRTVGKTKTTWSFVNVLGIKLKIDF